MSATTNAYGTFYDADPAEQDGVYGYRDATGAFKSNAELREIARAVLIARPDGRSARDVLSEALTDLSAADLLVDEVYQPDDVAEWALDPDTGLWAVA